MLSHLRFWGGNFFLITLFADHGLLVLFDKKKTLLIAGHISTPKKISPAPLNTLFIYTRSLHRPSLDHGITTYAVAGNAAEGGNTTNHTDTVGTGVRDPSSQQRPR